jgi:cystine transport system substrate-binding protein
MNNLGKAFIFTAILGSALAVVSTSASASNSLRELQSSGTFRVGTEGTYAPFTFHDKSGQLTGFDVEIAKEIAKRIGVKPEFIEAKWDGLIAGLDSDRYDAVINEVSITPERQKKYDFSEPYIVSKASLIVRADNTSIHSFADLKGKKSAHTLTSNYAKLASSYGAELVGTDGFNQSLDLVLSGRADATINDSLSYLDFKKHKPDANVKVAATEENAEKQGVILKKGKPELVQAINKALADIKKDGTYQRISLKYFGQDVSH